LATGGTPVGSDLSGASAVRVQVPHDPADMYVAVGLAHEWRMAVRASLQPLLSAGYSVARFVRADSGDRLPYYVLERD
jgi:predicted GNAT superfamily acetyltransferase